MTNPTNISEVLQSLSHDIVREVTNELIDRFKQGRRISPVEWSPEHQSKAKTHLKRIIEEALPEKFNKKAMVEANKKHFHIMYGYNRALDDVRQQLESLTKEGE